MNDNLLTILFTCCFFTVFAQGGNNISCNNFEDGPINAVEMITMVPFEIKTTGPNDLALNPLVEVKIKVNHNGISDVAISLQSPAGVEYLIIGDDGNNFGGCWPSTLTSFDVTIVRGTGSPFTNGMEYTLFCVLNDCQGDFTVFQSESGDNYSDVFDATACPTGDLNDFNQAGHAVEGIWIVKFACVCPNNEIVNQFYIEECELVFENQTEVDCFFAPPVTLNHGEELGCTYQGNALSQITGTANYNIWTEEYELALLAVKNDTVEYVFPTDYLPNFIAHNDSISLLEDVEMEAGIYEIYLLQRKLSSGPSSFISSEYLGVSVDSFAMLNTGFTAMISEEFVSLTIVEPMPPQEIFFTDHCVDECIEYNGIEYCTPGVYEFTDITLCALTVIHNEPNECFAGSLDPFSITACLDSSLILTSDLPAASTRWTFSNGEVIETESNTLLVTVDSYAEYLTVEVATIEYAHVIEDTQLITIFFSYCENEYLEVNTLNQSSVCFDGAIFSFEPCNSERTDFNFHISETGDCLLFTPEEYSCETVCLRYTEEDIPHDVTLEICVVESLIDAPDVNLQKGNSSTTSHFSVYPNPASSALTCSFSTELLRTITVMNIFGEELEQIEGGAFSYQFDISNYPTGVYFVTNQEGEENMTLQKFVKK